MSVLLEHNGAVARLTLSRPERRNALSPNDFAELHDMLAEIARSSSTRVVVITGAKGAFCAGADLSEAAQESTVVVMRGINDTMRMLHRMPQPCIAAVNGTAVGAGMSIALCCDIVIASTEARFCQVFVKRGLSPDTGSSWLLPRIVGIHTAKRLALLGDMVTPEQAQAIGLISEVVAPDSLEETVTKYARRFVEGPPIAMAFAKQLINASFTRNFDDALDAEAAANSVNAATEDTTEAFAAFAAKRPPLFRGR